MSEVRVFSVDRSWARYSGNADGDLMTHTKMHRKVEGDCLAVCSSRILLNSDGGELLRNYIGDEAKWLCLRCFPLRSASRAVKLTDQPGGSGAPEPQRSSLPAARS